MSIEFNGITRGRAAAKFAGSEREDMLSFESHLSIYKVGIWQGDVQGMSIGFPVIGIWPGAIPLRERAIE